MSVIGCVYVDRVCLCDGRTTGREGLVTRSIIGQWSDRFMAGCGYVYMFTWGESFEPTLGLHNGRTLLVDRAVLAHLAKGRGGMGLTAQLKGTATTVSAGPHGNVIATVFQGTHLVHCNNHESHNNNHKERTTQQQQ